MFIIINNTADNHGAVIAGNNLFNQGISRFTGPDNHNGYIIFPALYLMLAASEKTIGKTADKGKGYEQEKIHEIITVRNRFPGNLKQIQSHAGNHCGQKAGHDQILHFVLASKSPQAVIQTEKIENAHCNQDIHRKEVPDRHQELIRNFIQMHVIPEQNSQKAGCRHTEDIINNQSRPAIKQLIIKMAGILLFFILHFHLLFSSFSLGM